MDIRVNMDSIKQFIQSKNIDKHNIFSSLKCTLQEANILQFLTKQYINGITNHLTIDILSNFNDIKKLEHLDKINLIRNLLEYGWIEQADILNLKISKISNLQLLNTTIKLSDSFLKLLELGHTNLVLPKLSAYKDHLEYLQDQFAKIDLIQQLNTLKYDLNLSSPNIIELTNELELMEQRIIQRVNTTKITIMLEDFFTHNKLNKQEQTIFLALLKEEYTSSEESIRDMNSLISLVACDDYEKIKYRSLLEDSGNLIKNNIIDYDEILMPFGGISRNFYILDDILYKISHPNKKQIRAKKVKIGELIEKQTTFELLTPKKDLNSIVLNEDTKKTIDILLTQVNKDVLNKLKLWGIKDKKNDIEAKIIFYGDAGTGKTVTALAIAKELKKQILSFDCSKILSMYIGQSEKNVRAIFDSYNDICIKTKTKPILLLDEADQFLSNRISGHTSSSDKMHNQMQNIFLEQIEKFNGIIIATTNLLDSIDKAFSRRFNYKIEFNKPKQEQRKLLWEKLLPPTLPLKSDFNIDKLSSFELTGGQIELIIKNTAYKIASTKTDIFATQDFIDEINRELNSNFDKNIKVGFC